MQESVEERHLFIVRLWREATAAQEAAQWRGSVEHPTTHERSYFSQLEQMQTFIERVSGIVKPPPTNDPQPSSSDGEA